MSDIGATIFAYFEGAIAYFFGAASGLFSAGSRFFLPYLAVAIALGVIAFWINRRHLPKRQRKGVFSYIFDPSVYLQSSSLVDLKVVIANQILAPALTIFRRSAPVLSAYFVASLLVSAETIAEANAANITIATLAIVTLAVVLANDFTTYWVHRLHHEIPVFWPFHKLHHSAETLTPITFARKHPVYDLTRAIANVFVVGPVQGIIFALFGVVSFPVILGVNVIYASFHWSGSNLRHSHIWLSYGPVLNRILISPAQHQIHHSLAQRHFNKNYGEIFAIWDWMFGSLYVPDGYEAIEYGVSDETGKRVPQPHGSLKNAYLVPFKEAFAALNESNENQERTQSI